MRDKTRLWAKALAAAVITGGSNAGLASLGISAANFVGVSVPSLNARQIVGVCASGAFIGLLAYLKQSPVPPESTGDTQPPFKQP